MSHEAVSTIGPAAKLTPLIDAADASRFGGKASELARALAAGLPVPGGFALDVDASDAAFAGAPLEGAQSLLEGARWAVRSSAIGEDGASASFAGVHATRLHVPSPLLAAAIGEVIASARSDTALAYRRRMGVEGPPRMAVVVQRMVESEVAGVLFTRHPITGARERFVEASWGLGESVVGGLVTPDSFRVDEAGGVIERRPGIKDLAIVWDGAGGTREVEVDEPRASALCLDEARLAALCELAARVEAAIAGEHDLEWAFEEGGSAPFLLQRRPITARG